MPEVLPTPGCVRRRGRRSASGTTLPVRHGAPTRAQLLTHLGEPALRQPPAVEAALSQAVIGLISVITAMEAAITTLEVAMAAEFDQHPAAELLRAAPGSRRPGAGQCMLGTPHDVAPKKWSRG
jgi:hypothetical protein